MRAADESRMRWFQSTPSGGKATDEDVLALLNSEVSIHAFRGEGDEPDPAFLARAELFQSTPSGGKATWHHREDNHNGSVSIHAFRGEGDLADHRAEAFARNVSIHAFRGEGDVCHPADSVCGGAFQSTPSGGKAMDIYNSSPFVLVFQSTPSGGKATLTK